MSPLVPRLVLFPLSTLPAIYDPVVFSYAFNPFFLVRGARRRRRRRPICAAAKKTRRALRTRLVCACLRKGEGTRVEVSLRRFNERYYDLVALDIAHINPRGTLILGSPGVNSAASGTDGEARGAQRPENLLIAKERKRSPSRKKDDRVRK